MKVNERMQINLPRKVDEEGSEMFEACIKNSKIKLDNNSKAEKFDGTDKVEGIQLDSGEIIKADVVIISSGIIPNKELAEKAGLEINRGIVVNEKMETSQKDIYACGDVAEYKGNVIGLWQISLDQGKIAGLNAVGIVENYEDKIQPVTFEGMGTKIFSAGGVIETQDSICEKDYDDLIYKKLNCKNNELMSGILIGDTEQGITIIKGLKEKEKKGNLLKKFYK